MTCWIFSLETYIHIVSAARSRIQRDHSQAVILSRHKTEGTLVAGQKDHDHRLNPYSRQTTRFFPAHRCWNPTGCRTLGLVDSNLGLHRDSGAEGGQAFFGVNAVWVGRCVCLLFASGLSERRLRVLGTEMAVARVLGGPRTTWVTAE